MPLLSRVKDIFKGGSLNKKKKHYHNVKLENPEEIWQIVAELGDGAYGKVYKAQHKVTEKLAALKLVSLDAEDDLDTFMVEIDILTEFKHPNIVELLEAYHYDGKLWMYLEYCDGGAVDSIMMDLDRSLNEAQISNICEALCEALVYIHYNKVIHRDLKAGNVLLTLDGGIKLADFGVSARNKNTFDKRGTFIGTPYWLAPEVILCETFIDAKYDYKADIWSLGICLIEFAQMEPPNHDVSPVRVMLKIQKSDPPKLDQPLRWSKEFNDFIAMCLVKDPLLRPTAEDLLKHPFLNKSFDRKPILDLLLEFTAEIVEEVEEESEENDQCRVTAGSDSFTLDSKSIASVDKSSCIEKIVIGNDNEINDVSFEKRASKGPAPLPPFASTSSQALPKKGPAPLAPSVLSSDSSNNTDASTSISVTSASLESPFSNVSDGVVEAVSVVVVASDPASHVIIDKERNISSMSEENDRTSVSKTSISEPELKEVNDERYLNIDDHTSLETTAGKKLESEVIEKENLGEFNSNIENCEFVDPESSVGSLLVTQNVGIIGVPITTDESNEGVKVLENSLLANCEDIPLRDKNSKLEEMEKLQNSHQPSSGQEMLSLLLDESVDVIHSGYEGGSLPISSDVIVVSKCNEESVTGLTPLHSSKGDSHGEIKLSNSCDASNSHNLDKSFGEDEAQAVHILDTAIDSAYNDMSYSGSNVNLPEANCNTNELTEELVELTNSGGEIFSSSEVTSNLSNIADEGDSGDLSVVSKGNNSTSLIEVTSDYSCRGESHVSVISVVQSKPHSPPTSSPISHDPSDSNSIHSDSVMTCVHFPTPLSANVGQVSLKIEGSTVEDTDVDQMHGGPLFEQQFDGDGEDLNIVPETLKVAIESDFALNESDSLASDCFPDKTVDDHVAKNDSVNQINDTNYVYADNVIKDSPDRPSNVLSTSERNQHVLDDAKNDALGRKVSRDAVSSPRSVPVDPALVTTRLKKEKEYQESVALKKKTRKRTRKFVIDGVVVTTTTSKVIYGEDEEQGVLSSAHLARKQELRELKVIQRREQKQFQDLSIKANIVKHEQEKKFEVEKLNLLRSYDSQLENLIRQQKQLVERAETKQDLELKLESKKVRCDQERELKAFKESLKQEWKLLKQEVELLPKDRKKENLKMRKEQLERDHVERERVFLDRLNDQHEMVLKRLNDKHREHIALKERQFLEEKHQLLRSRESAIWDIEERHIQDKHQLAKEQLKDIYFLQRLQMTIRHNVELEQVRRYNHQKEDDLLKRQNEERRQLPKRIRQEMKTREKMFKEQIRISMSSLSSHEQEKNQMKKFQEQEKIKYDKERKRAELKHQKQMEELSASMESSIKELVLLQNEKGKLLTEHETYKLKCLDDEYQKEIKEWKSNLAPRKQNLEEDFDFQLKDQERFYADYLDKGLSLLTANSSQASLRSTRP